MRKSHGGIGLALTDSDPYFDLRALLEHAKNSQFPIRPTWTKTAPNQPLNGV
jgi:hypothetical protein